MRRSIFLLLLLAAIFHPAHALSQQQQKQIPDSLKPWVGWVKDASVCPQVTGEKPQDVCAWPGELALTQQEAGQGVSFKQQWLVYKPSMIPLPGDPASWPVQVKVGDVAVPVVARGGQPFVQLQPGSHVVAGSLQGNQGDKAFRLPGNFVLVSFTSEGKAAPVWIDQQNFIWFKPVGVRDESRATPDKDSLSIKVFRKFTDAVPTDITTRLRLTVSGKKREVKLGKVLIAGAVPYSISGQLKASMNDSGEVSVIVQPGIWELTVKSYLSSDAGVWKRDAAGSEFWPSTEYWFFQRQPELFRSKLAGAPIVDPKSVDAPNEWGTLAGYSIQRDGLLEIERISRGTNTTGETRANIQRDAWLSLDGESMFIQDIVAGQARPYSSLTVLPGQFQPQSLYLNNQAQVLTQTAEGIGVSLRQKHLNARVLGKMPVNGEFKLPGNAYHELQADSLLTALHLPPGWRVLSASDAVDGRTWLSSWTFYQMFLLIIISIVFFRMVGPGWGLFAALTLGITFHEPETPILAWLVLLAIIAILREGMANYPRLQKLLVVGKSVTLVVIAFLLLAYTVNHIKDAVHPQLNWHAGVAEFGNQRGMTVDTTEEASADYASAPARMAAPMSKMASGAMLQDGMKRYRESEIKEVLEDKVEHKRENEMPATSGLPQWNGKVVHLDWNKAALQSPAAVKLVMMTPAMNLVFGFVSSLMLIVLFLAAAGIKIRPLLERLPKAGKKSVVALLFSLIFSSSAQGNESEFPPRYLLEQLAKEVNQPAACLPNCASTDRLSLTLDEAGHLRLQFEINVLENTAVPLLTIPQTGIQFTGFSRHQDSQKALPLLRKGKLLLANLDHGRHEVVLLGSISAESMQIGLPLSVREYSENVSGWQPAHSVKNRLWQSLSFKAVKSLADTAGSSAEINSGLPQTQLPGYFGVTRQLQLNDGIFLNTRIHRMSPPGTVEEVSIPAWPQEVLLASGEYLQRDGDMIKVKFNAGDQSRSFRSSLQFTDDELSRYQGGVLRSLQLPPAASAQLTTWSFDYSGLWDIEVEGLPLIYQQNNHGNNLKMLRPWAGEAATINLRRAAPVPGATVSVQNANVSVSPYSSGKGSGQHGQIELQAKIETTRAQTLVLKSDARLKDIMVNGHRINSDPGTEIRVPFDVGSFMLSASGELAEGVTANYKMPEFTIETQAGEPVEIFNVSAQIEMPQERWVFSAAGSGVGPDFLFWSILPSLILIAIALHFFGFGGMNGFGWFLVMIGFTQANSFGLYFGLGMSTLFIGWLFLLRQRENMQPFKMNHFRFNAFQLLLILLSIGVLISMANGLYSGLLGNPKMQVAGNGSNAYLLRWFDDQGMPEASVRSLPMIYYRGALLIWEIWLSFVVIGWIKYAWNTFTKETMFRSAPEIAITENAEKTTDSNSKNNTTGLVVILVLGVLIAGYVVLSWLF